MRVGRAAVMQSQIGDGGVQSTTIVAVVPKSGIAAQAKQPADHSAGVAVIDTMGAPEFRAADRTSAVLFHLQRAVVLDGQAVLLEHRLAMTPSRVCQSFSAELGIDRIFVSLARVVAL